jgi:hypothetical protein
MREIWVLCEIPSKQTIFEKCSDLLRELIFYGVHDLYMMDDSRKQGWRRLARWMLFFIVGVIYHCGRINVVITLRDIHVGQNQRASSTLSRGGSRHQR